MSLETDASKVIPGNMPVWAKLRIKYGFVTEKELSALQGRFNETAGETNGNVSLQGDAVCPDPCKHACQGKGAVCPDPCKHACQGKGAVCPDPCKHACQGKGAVCPDPCKHACQGKGAVCPDPCKHAGQAKLTL